MTKELLISAIKETVRHKKTIEECILQLSLHLLL